MLQAKRGNSDKITQRNAHNERSRLPVRSWNIILLETSFWVEAFDGQRLLAVDHPLRSMIQWLSELVDR